MSRALRGAAALSTPTPPINHATSAETTGYIQVRGIACPGHRIEMLGAAHLVEIKGFVGRRSGNAETDVRIWPPSLYLGHRLIHVAPSEVLETENPDVCQSLERDLCTD